MARFTLMLCLLASPAWAGFDLSGHHIGFYVGDTHYDASNLYDDYDYDRRATSFGLFTAAPINDWLDIEGRYTYHGRYEVRESSLEYWRNSYQTVVSSLRLHHGISDTVSLYGRAGLGLVLLEQKTVLWQGGNTLDLASLGLDLQAGLGMSWQFHPKLALTLDLDHHSFLVESRHRTYTQSLITTSAGLRYTF
ncbi:outer membrane beta-barrel protein [Ferrimonas marina]|uniref:Outer membrane protein beta-barrel domain-containing protein n=1 Tax=Ferrimonas marina TaxID=299255 RepID=A0A1M5Z930_9GAMM|nr:outer membrane beta-barrel protein [Ferrimonas marina]SHI20756.1 Outer membrane protein beta-barrel domain-containing protein [Ferrimonas marina]